MQRHDAPDSLQRPRFQPLTSPTDRPSLGLGYLFFVRQHAAISLPFLPVRQVWLSQSALALLLRYLHSLLLLYERCHVQYVAQIASKY